MEITPIKVSTNPSVHMQEYRGDLSTIFSHRPEWRQNVGPTEYLRSAHDYVDNEKLKQFLCGKNVLVGHEASFPELYVVNGTRFWSFHSDPQEHAKIMKEQFGDGSRCYVPDSPVYLPPDKCSLVTSANVMKSDNGKYKAAFPEEYSSGNCFLGVSVKVATRPNLFSNLKWRNELVNMALADVRREIMGKADETADAAMTQAQFDLGFYAFHGVEGIVLRSSTHDNYLWAQQNMLPAIKEIFSNHAFCDAIAIREGLTALKRFDYTPDHPVKRKVMENDYSARIGTAAGELQSDQNVVRSLNLM